MIRPPVFGKVFMQLQDQFSRKFYYLRLSITDVCNFKCNYCLPDGYKADGKPEFLGRDELRRIVTGFAEMGTEKVRITGGEPSLRKDFTDIISDIAAIPKINKVATTTNGFNLEKYAQQWRDAGLDAINVSIDSLDARMFRQITGKNMFHKVMAGLDAAFTAGFETVKVNTVLMRNLNDIELDDFLNWIKTRPIQLRFIELMQTGDNQALFDKHHVSGASIRDKLILQGWVSKVRGKADGPAQVFIHPDYVGEIGLIMPYEKNFCSTCNRLRVSTKGRLHLCLFGEAGVELRDLVQDDNQQQALINRVVEHMSDKKSTHFLQDGFTANTPHLASIGG